MTEEQAEKDAEHGQDPSTGLRAFGELVRGTVRIRGKVYEIQELAD